MHEGSSLSSGHYIASALNVSQNVWYEYNDYSVSKIDYPYESKTAITLVYVRADLLDCNKLSSSGIYKELSLLNRCNDFRKPE